MVIPREQGETAHVERWNTTLRQRLARFVRMTLSFSKSELMHEACLLLFLHRYNLDRAILLKWATTKGSSCSVYKKKRSIVTLFSEIPFAASLLIAR